MQTSWHILSLGLFLVILPQPQNDKTNESIITTRSCWCSPQVTFSTNCTGHMMWITEHCILHCTLYSVHSTLYTVQFTLYNSNFTLYSVHCTGTPYSVKCILYTVHCTMYTHLFGKISSSRFVMQDFRKRIGSIVLCPFYFQWPSEIWVFWTNMESNAAVFKRYVHSFVKYLKLFFQVLLINVKFSFFIF